jgi:NTE family protein
MLYRITLRIIFILFAVTSILKAQTPSPERPKIGYVLSGGGAKGMAHVGVLKVLEEVGLRPDYITGTSMGSIIGGLYSIGYSAEEISTMIENIDWGTVLTNEIPANQVIISRKHEYNRYLLQMPIYHGKPQLPSGLIEGQKLSQLFSELTWRQAGVDDFGSFPVPYICIGTDLLKGEMVEMNSGDLSSAMRASMAIPSVFTPVIRDTSHILVDGGVVRNFPVQEAIDMGADIIIGVYVGFERKISPDELHSLTSIMMRTSLLSGTHDVEDQIQYVDYLIVPDLEGYTSSSFSDGVAIMDRGEAAARSQIDLLRALSDSVNGIQAAPDVNMLPVNDSIFITEIMVEPVSPSMTRFIIEKSELETGTWITPEVLNEGINRLFGTLFFDRIDYSFVAQEDGYRLVLRVTEKTPSSLNVALHYDNFFGPGLILNYTLLNALKEGSRAGITVDISGSPQMNGYFDLHLGKKRNFVTSLFINGERDERPIFQNNVDIGNYHHTYLNGGLAIRQMLGTNHQLGMELYYRYSALKLSKNIKEVMPELAWLDNFIYRGPELAFQYQVNTYDHYLYPTRGIQAQATYRQALGTRFISNYNFPDSLDVTDDQSVEIVDPYWHLTAGFESYLPLGKKISFNSEFTTGLSDNNKPFTDNYYLGGYRYNLRKNQVPFVGMHINEALNGNYLKEKLALQMEVIPKLYASALGNLMIVSDDISTFLDEILSWSEQTRYIGVGAGLTYRTPIGPVSVYLGSRTDIWNPIWYTNLGFTF